MAPNVPAMLELHFAVPALGAVLNALNVRLDAPALAFCLAHGGAKVVVTDPEYAPAMKPALARLGRDVLVVDIDDPEGPAASGSAASRTKRCSPKAIPRSRCPARSTNGTRCRCSTRRARPAIPRAWSTTTAAPT
jgi:acyl-CoA synthetase (AMP-forming)/AMP-acid ligase II